MNEQIDKLRAHVQTRQAKIENVQAKIENVTEKIERLTQHIDANIMKRAHFEGLVRRWRSFIKKWVDLNDKAERKIRQLENEPQPEETVTSDE